MKVLVILVMAVILMGCSPDQNAADPNVLVQLEREFAAEMRRVVRLPKLLKSKSENKTTEIE